MTRKHSYALCAALAALCVTPAAALDFGGRAEVIDGDTIAVEGTEARIRLFGIDAPENGQTCDDALGQRYLCGSDAAATLANLIGRNGQVTCREKDRDRYGRVVADCTTTDGKSLGAEMVRSGFALAYHRYGGGIYTPEENEARADTAGMWRGNFILPWDWRGGDRLASETADKVRQQDCDIAGNISGTERIYHMPGGEFYGRTGIDMEAGERWFCSAAEAEAAGWRAAKQ